MKFLLLIIPLLLLTGCGVAGKYNEAYISKSIETNYKKIDSVNICILKNNENITMTRIQQKVFSNPVHLELPVNKISNEVTSLFLSQYFNKNNNCTYYLKFETIDYSFYLTSGFSSNMTLEYRFKISLLKDNNTLYTSLLW